MFKSMFDRFRKPAPPIGDGIHRSAKRQNNRTLNERLGPDAPAWMRSGSGPEKREDTDKHDSGRGRIHKITSKLGSRNRRPSHTPPATSMTRERRWNRSSGSVIGA